MTRIQHIDREQLQQALQVSGCRVDLDAVMSNPTLARCLLLTAKAMQAETTAPSQTPAQPADPELVWAKRLLSLVGKNDWARLRAGDNEKEKHE